MTAHNPDMVVTGHTREENSGEQPPPEDAAGGTDANTGRGGGSRPVSIRDVAAAAGVSYQTVSRVINGHPSVKGSTRELVVATITRLGFRPNRAARALAGGPIQAVTVLTANTTLYGQRSAIQGIEEAARAADFAVGVRVIEADEPAVVTDAVERAIEPGGALIVVAFDRASTRALAAVPPGIPMVGIVETPVGDEGEGQPWIWINDRQAATEATEYLLGLGHRTVHYVSIPWSHRTSQRLDGGGRPRARAGTGRVASANGLRGGPVARRRPGGDRRAVRERRPGPRSHQGDARGGAADPGQRQRGRLRRHPAVGVLHARPDHGAPGFHRTRAGGVRRARRADRHRPVDQVAAAARAGRAGELGAAAPRATGSTATACRAPQVTAGRRSCT